MSVPPRAVQLNEANAFLKEHPEVQFVDLLIADMNGVVRGKRIERNSLHKVYEKGINLPASLFALDINGSTVESTGLGLDIGDADRICFPIANTLCNEPWQKRPTAQLLMTMHEMDGKPFFADPREVLRQIVAKFDDMNLRICAAFELEFYLIDQENVNGRPQPPRSPLSGKRPQSTQVYLYSSIACRTCSKPPRNRASRPMPSSRKAPRRSSRSTCTTWKTPSRPATTRCCSSA
jgi:glutamine synthetase